MTSLFISGPYSWLGIARPGPTLPPPMHPGNWGFDGNGILSFFLVSV